MDMEYAQIDVGIMGGERSEKDQVTIKASLTTGRGEKAEAVEEPTEAEESAELESPVFAQVEVEPPPRQITVGVVPVWGVGLGWILTIILVSQACKGLLVALGAKEWLSAKIWSRWKYVVPVIFGTILSALFGPSLGELFGMRFGIWASVIFLGPGSGAAAAFGYDIIRQVLLPLLPATAIGIVERVTGLKLPEEATDRVVLTLDEDSEID